MNGHFRKLLIISSICLGLAACGDSGSGHSDKRGGDGIAKPVTGEEDCRSGPPATSIIGSWLTQYEGKNVHMDIVFEFSNHQVTVTNHCEFPGMRLSAQVQSSVTIYPDQVQIWEDQYDYNEYDDGENRANCEISVEQSRINYDFYGSCLVFDDGNGNNLYLKKMQ